MIQCTCTWLNSSICHVNFSSGVTDLMECGTPLAIFVAAFPPPPKKKRKEKENKDRKKYEIMLITHD